MDDTVFDDLVNRELRKRASKEERAYLWLTPDTVLRWRTVLIAIKSGCSVNGQKIKTNLEAAHAAYLEAPRNEEGRITEETRSAYHAYRDEQNRKKDDIHWIHTNVDIRLARIRAWSRERAEHEHEEEYEYNAFQDGVTHGWKAALQYITSQLDAGCSYEGAFASLRTKVEEVSVCKSKP